LYIRAWLVIKIRIQPKNIVQTMEKAHQELSGVMINRDGRMWLNEDYVDKQCFADKECNYFNNIVIPGIPAHG